MTIEQTLTERGNQYGKFSEHARITQNLKHAPVPEEVSYRKRGQYNGQDKVRAAGALR